MKTQDILKFTLALGTFFLANMVSAQSVSLRIGLSPLGSFVAESKIVNAVVKKNGDTLKLESAEFSLDSLKSGVELRDEHMKKKYFETEEFPLAKIKNAEGSGGTFRAELELRGVRKEIKGTYTISGEQLIASFSTKMSDFKIPKASYMGIGAKDEVKIECQLPIVSSTASATGK
jgi:hypothetical protein